MMLVTRELTKIYRPKKGVPVMALKQVSLTFPDKGMVFLLGKPGSGKSTFLNVLAGLEQYDSGEIRIKGVSSKSLTQGDFDSYRNTYMGFISQESRLLDEFTVGENIALAIELQNRKASNEDIHQILRDMEMDGYENRMTKELSLSQKRKVAIARALVKNPEIIMADEPARELDATTGRQIFDMLKKVSEKRLVIIASGERDLVLQYADRIIELSEGNVISDVECSSQNQSVQAFIRTDTGPADIFKQGVRKETSASMYMDSAASTHMDSAASTHMDSAASTHMDSAASTHMDSAAGTHMDSVASTHMDSAASTHMYSAASTYRSELPNQSTDIHTETTRLPVKSRLPWKKAVKIGAGALKCRKIRLALTILLSSMALIIVGFSDIIGSENRIQNDVDSLIDSNMDYVAITKERDRGYGSGYAPDSCNISEFDRSEISQVIGEDVIGVYLPEVGDLRFGDNTNTQDESTQLYAHSGPFGLSFSGYAEMNQTLLDEFGYHVLAGTLPDGQKDEIAISAFVFEAFKRADYKEYNGNAKDETAGSQKINTYQDMIGKKLYFDGKAHTVTGIIDTKLDLERYSPLFDPKKGTDLDDSMIVMLDMEYTFEIRYGLSNMVMVGEGFIKRRMEADAYIRPTKDREISCIGETYEFSSSILGKLEDFSNRTIFWADEKKSRLAEDEIIVSSIALSRYRNRNDDSGGKEEDLQEVYKTMLSGESTVRMSYRSNDGKMIDRNCKIVGVLELGMEDIVLQDIMICGNQTVATVTEDRGLAYDSVVCPVPQTKANVQKLVEYCSGNDSAIRFRLHHPAIGQQALFQEIPDMSQNTPMAEVIVRKPFYVGIIFVALAVLLLSNFMTASISCKNQEIGALRTMGAGSDDVFRIFLTESFMLAMINFILSSAGLFALTKGINHLFQTQMGIPTSLFRFGIEQLIFLFAVNIFATAVAGILPIWRVASKCPMDAVRGGK